MAGFVKLHRELLEWTWANDIVTFGVYTKFLLMAAWKETEYHGVKLERGELLTNQSEIAKECGLTRQQVRTVLDRLKATNKITTRRNGKNSIIKVIDYDCETDSNHIDNHISTTCQPDCNQTTLFIKENKNRRSEESTRASGFNEVKQLFNSICVSLPPLEYDLTIAQAHLVEQAQTNLRDSSFEEFFKCVEKSDFLCGRAGGSFKATFDWILKPENMFKILSGNYDRNFKQAQPQAAPAQKSWSELTPEEAAAQAAHFYD